MKISPNTPLAHSASTEKSATTQSQKVTNLPAGHEQGAPSSLTHLSHPHADTRQDIDMARVTEIRDAIREGRLHISPERIADGLLASVRDMLDKETPQ
ncbi:flagellar biosynthesis anti-sigma factor FlgM [Halomonas binhaiensis]|uniref:Negative regulator of flagellin synthesis n=1 Tax=Halomonas binhaiensis TaxID=2562282 RepID=A0A5C1NMY9_9GAMM|nr:flagellar biosynthesis anti-sigma factor FlgM [Halomonas binhaiensis]QEM83808.1 flagellar biosynthesis anti-sigma factor FlgM [Halomonas binhaiensis]